MFLSPADLLSKLTFSKSSFMDMIRVSTSLDQDQDRRFIGLGFGQNCLLRLSADAAAGKWLKRGTPLENILFSVDNNVGFSTDLPPRSVGYSITNHGYHTTVYQAYTCSYKPNDGLYMHRYCSFLICTTVGQASASIAIILS